MAPKITLFAHGLTPNPPKVAILLEELGVEYAVESRVSRPYIITGREVIEYHRNLVMARKG